MRPPIPEPPTLVGPTVTVRPWTHDDVDAVVAASHDPVIPTITSVPADTSLDDAHACVDRQIARPVTDLGHARAIAAVDDEVIGHLYTSLVFHHVGRAEMGYWTLPASPGRGGLGRARPRGDLGARPSRDQPHHPLHRAVERGVDPHRRTGRVHLRRPAAGWDTYDDRVPRDMLAIGRLPSAGGRVGDEKEPTT